MRFDVFMVVNMLISIFWVVMLCSFVGVQDYTVPQPRIPQSTERGHFLQFLQYMVTMWVAFSQQPIMKFCVSRY
jgi:hypothetical protein